MKFTKAEIDAIIEASPRTFVPFNKLVLSEEHQARVGGSTPAMSIAELAASIKDSGVLQNLVVVQGARGRCEVCAGGRRLEALTLLVSNSDIPENYPVPVLIVPADNALIASLSENCFDRAPRRMPAARTAGKVDDARNPGEALARRIPSPSQSVVKRFGAARDHSIAAPTQRVRGSAPARGPTRSV